MPEADLRSALEKFPLSEELRKRLKYFRGRLHGMEQDHGGWFALKLEGTPRESLSIHQNALYTEKIEAKCDVEGLYDPLTNNVWKIAKVEQHAPG